MTSYYIDPERCFEVPFRIPLPDKGTMAARLASIHLIMRDARERQSQFCAEYRQRLSSQPCRYRHKAKAMMEMGLLKSFVGNLARRYFDYLDFHQESPKELSPLAIQIPSLCPSLSPQLSHLFGPPRQDDFNSIIKSNLSWSQFAAPAPAGWREQFLHARRWEHDVEHRIMIEYSDSEREAEYAALEAQRRQLRACLRTEAETPPPLGRKHLIPLPLTTPSLLLLNAPPGDEGARIGSEAVTDVGLSTIDDTRSNLERSTLSFHPSPRRPSLRIVIPGSDDHEPWLGGPIFGSPLVRSLDMPPLLRSPLTPRSVREWHRCTFPIYSSQRKCRSGLS
ncbi:hypothetical protein EI94DRAFT_165159 [Lactarius quietus]|nr:hypothetical protein EI94DRAFT_165159 [Lactarius quietus]